jgi:predicted dehydrogenase
MDKVRLAMVGVNYPHALYRDTLRSVPEAEIVAFYDPDPEAARAKLHPAQRDIPVYDDLEALLRDRRPEAAMVFLPNNVRPAVLARLAGAGIHLLAEKPVATTAAALRETVAAVEQSGIVFYAGYQWRRHPLVQLIKSYVEQGILGALTLIELRYVTHSVTLRDPRHMHFRKEIAGGGILHWLGCHWIDLARFVTSREITSVMAFADNLSGEEIDVESVAAVAFRFDGGMLGTLNCGYVYPKHGSDAYLGLRGTLGWVDWDLFTLEATINSVHPDWYPSTTRKLTFNEEEVEGYGGGVGAAFVRDWIRAIRGGPRLSSIHDAVRTLQVIEAAYESARTGRRVDL